MNIRSLQGAKRCAPSKLLSRSCADDLRHHAQADQGGTGLSPCKVTCALEQSLNQLVDQDPLQHGSLYSQWSCRALATVLAHQTGIQLGHASIHGV